MKGLKYLIGLSALATLLNFADIKSQIGKDISSVYNSLYKNSQEVNKKKYLEISKVNLSQIEAEINNGLKVETLFVDNTSTPQKPDYATTTIYEKENKKWKPINIFKDFDLNGIQTPDYETIETFDPKFLLQDDYLIKRDTDFPKSIFSDDNKAPINISRINTKLLSCLEELLIYSSNPEGKLKAPYDGDFGSLYPNELPTSGLINWVERIHGFQTTTIDIIFHDELVDRILLTKINPELFEFHVHNDLNLKSIKEWRNDLGATVVINGSYYANKPYGLPITPTLNKGKRLDNRKNYHSKHGAFFAEPKDELKAKVKFRDFSTPTLVDSILELEEYNTVIFSYPTLLNEHGDNKAVERPKKRANRTFIAQDNQGHILFGNTQGGFFSLRRLGDFLKESDLDLIYALNMDGGPPACIDIKAGNFKYINYGQWESVPSNGKEIFVWNDKNTDEWKIPIVISAKPRK